MAVVGCSKNPDDTNNSSPAIEGSWRVSLFSERGSDETSDFSGYLFSFNQGGVLQVSGTGSRTGSWSKTSSKFNIDLGPKTDATKPLTELTDDWQIISITDQRIELTDDNISREELLTFTKN